MNESPLAANPLRRLLVALFLAIGFASSARAEHWDWGLTERQQAFCDARMPAALKLRETEGAEASIAAIEEIYQLAEQQFRDAYFFHKVVWYEAQLRGGRADERWGLRIYEYLWERDLRTGPENALRLRESMYILLGNTMGVKYSLGRAAAARQDAVRLENYLVEQKGMDLISPGRYEDVGAIFDFDPIARNRNFPIYEHQLPVHLRSPTTRTKIDFIAYGYIYFIDRIAQSALATGDWVRSAELSAWSINYTDEYLKGENFRRGEVGRSAGYDSYQRLAELSLLHGQPGEAARFMREYLVKAHGYYRAGGYEFAQANLTLALIGIQTGELDESALALVDDAVEALETCDFMRRISLVKAVLKRARVYHALGRGEDAWGIVNKQFEEAETDANPHMENVVINAAIDLALADGATHPELEKWLARALNHERRMGDKFKELPLYEKYAQFLMVHGRTADAIQIQSEAVRLAKAMSLPKRHQDNQNALAEMIKQRPGQTGAGAQAEQRDTPRPNADNTSEIAVATDGEAVAVDAPLREVDIQPRQSLSAALEGKPAYGRFYLHNPSVYPKKGELSLSGPIGEPQWRSEQWLIATSSPVLEEISLEKDLVLQPGESYVIDFTGLPENGLGAEIACQWTPEGAARPSVTGRWKYERSASRARTSVIDAHIYKSNPFYLIPVHHMIQRAEVGVAEVVDFKIKSSLPMRIEAYAAQTGGLLAIDANGDGDFLDEGDFIATDTNRNSWPDIVFNESQTLASLVLYVKPLQHTGMDDQELTVMIRNEDEWRIDAIDVIKAKSE